jgi:hypothetical protein
MLRQRVRPAKHPQPKIESGLLIAKGAENQAGNGRSATKRSSVELERVWGERATTKTTKTATTRETTRGTTRATAAGATTRETAAGQQQGKQQGTQQGKR